MLAKLFFQGTFQSSLFSCFEFACKTFSKIACKLLLLSHLCYVDTKYKANVHITKMKSFGICIFYLSFSFVVKNSDKKQVLWRNSNAYRVVTMLFLWLLIVKVCMFLFLSPLLPGSYLAKSHKVSSGFWLVFHHVCLFNKICYKLVQ